MEVHIDDDDDVDLDDDNNINGDDKKISAIFFQNFSFQQILLTFQENYI